MYIGVKTVEALENYRLSLTFENDEQGIFDMSSYLNTGIFKELRDTTLFQSAHVCFDTVEWSNGADMCPELLYQKSVRVVNADRETHEPLLSNMRKERLGI